MRQIGIGLLGFGTVGAGVVDGLTRHAPLLRDRLGVEPVLRRIADLDLDTDRGVMVDRDILTRDAAAVVADPDIEIVVELIGGCGVARELVAKALRLGKPVVTANKKLLAEHGREIVQLAAENQAGLHFGASVGGGIPIVRALRDGLVGNAISCIYGILNGTCNYILTRMERDGFSFGDALAAAQREGYAEADPSLDIDGLDTAHKTAILATLAYGASANLEDIPVEGIRDFSPMDVSFANDLGYRVKLLAVVERDGDAVAARVRPTLVPHDHMLAAVNDVFNAVMVRGDLCDDTLFQGRGAGRLPTASTVIGDIADAAVNLASGRTQPPGDPGRFDRSMTIRPLADLTSCYYLRLSVRDRPGSLGAIAHALGEYGVSIASVRQKASRQEDNFVPVVALTHEARENSIREALDRIGAMNVVDAPPVRIPILG